MSVFGHSLGSAIVYDILSEEHHLPQLDFEVNVHAIPTTTARPSSLSCGCRCKTSLLQVGSDDNDSLNMALTVLVLTGSPAPVFVVTGGYAQMAAQGCCSPVCAFADSVHWWLLGETISPVSYYPKAARYFNVLHPSDPVAYRFEPLVCGDSPLEEPQTLPHYSSNAEQPSSELECVQTSVPVSP